MQFAHTDHIIVGAERTDRYLPLLRHKRVAVLANQTSMVGHRHLIDLLLDNQVRVVKIFGPEHGFGGTADDVVSVSDGADARWGIPVISLWRSLEQGDPEKMNSLWDGYKKPDRDDLADVDVRVMPLA